MDPLTGSTPSFTEFVNARSPALLRSAWLLAGDVHRSEDLVQSALAKAWPRWDSTTFDSAEAYVRRVMYTTYVSWWRRKWRAEQATEVPPGTVTADATEVTLTREVVRSALAQLPRGQRAVVVLRFFDDLSEAETAHALGISTGTVKSQSSRALARLREIPAIIDLLGVDL